MIHPEDWARMSWHARQKAQHRAMLYLKTQMSDGEWNALDEGEPVPETKEQRLVRARIYKANGTWYCQTGSVHVACSTHDEALEYLFAAAA